MSLLEVHGLTKAFGGVHAVADLNFTVAPGRVHSIIGPNGAGKTTLFNLVTGLYAPTAGRIVLDGEDVTALPTAARPAVVDAAVAVDPPRQPRRLRSCCGIDAARGPGRLPRL
jgi:ABC-type branched-subunit amino acid transport system ATPase component